MPNLFISKACFISNFDKHLPTKRETYNNPKPKSILNMEQKKQESHQNGRKKINSREVNPFS
jgi:hypothetical protein